MATNRFFNHIAHVPEQNLYEDLVVENIQISGMDVIYLPRDMEGIDDILREPYRSTFKSSHKIEVYFHDVSGWGGEGDLMSKFGFAQKDSTNVSLAKRRWRELKIPTRLDRPVEGDLLYIPMTKSLFQVNFVEHEDPFWQLGKYMVFKLSCSLYVNGSEKFETGVPEIDGFAGRNQEEEITKHINDALKTKSNTLVSTDESNPFGGF